MMEKCEICGEHSGVYWGWVDDRDTSRGEIHLKCRNEAVSKYIAERVAARPKELTLEERVVTYLINTSGNRYAEVAAGIVAMVREHDAERPKEMTFGERVALAMFRSDQVDWKARAEKAEAKLAAILSELST